MHRLLIALALSLLATVGARAECVGRNLLADLTGEERGALDAAVARQPFPSGNHWRARKGDSTISVIGTFHIDDQRMAAVVERIGAVIDAADAVYLEATDTEIAQLKSALARSPDLVIQTEGPTLREQLDDADWALFSQAMADRGVPAFMASKFRPWYVMTLLGMPACAMPDPSAGMGGLDRKILDRAQAAGVPARALEPYDTVFGLFDAFDDADMIEMLRMSLASAGQSEDLFATMVDLYFAEDHRMIWELGLASAELAAGADPAAVQDEMAAMEEAVLLGRNRNWMEVILPAAEHAQIVVAVGAGHLAGEDGLLNLLAKAGYTLDRQPF